MAGFSVSVPHGIGRKAAIARLRLFLDGIRRNYAHEVTDVRRRWHGNRLEFAFAASGLQVQGTLVVEEEAVHISGPPQLAVLLFRDRIEETIQQELAKLLR